MSRQCIYFKYEAAAQIERIAFVNVLYQLLFFRIGYNTTETTPSSAFMPGIG